MRSPLFEKMRRAIGHQKQQMAIAPSVTATNVYLIFYPKPDIAKAFSGKLELQEVSGV
ncbi:MAG: hypothetical protein HC789_08700 [Microcoleus sp. CSU_2_2]|nr:hypothetical protein [Microcoleus sp. SU_5_3]NJS10443.1 hypothetical protein [Microcoleus sp. CSU_2_2]